MLKLASKCAPEANALKNATQAGFRHVELWLNDTLLADWEGVAHVVRQFPVSCALHFPNQLELAHATLRQAVALYRELSCSCLVIHQPMYDRYHETLLHLAPELCLAVENHKLSQQGLADWAYCSPALTLDVEHLWKFTLRDAPPEKLIDEVEKLLGRYARKLRHIHLPGYWPGLPEHRPMYCAREMILPVLSVLARARFDGFVVSEVDVNYQNRNDLRMDVMLFEAWRDQHLQSSSVAASLLLESLPG